MRLQLRRLRQPRYLLGLAAAGAYLYWLVLRRLAADAPTRPLPPSAVALVEVPLLLMGVASVASAWLFGRDRPLVTFTETEVQLLFPAPLTRRQLLHYKLARFLLRGLVGALLSTVLLGRALAGHPALFALGSWLGLSILGMHATAASLTRAALVQRGASRLWRRGLPVAGALAYAALLVVSVWEAGLPPLGRRPADLEVLALWVEEVLGSGLLALLLAPVRLPLQVALAREAGTLLWALPLSLALLALHYRWVLATDVAFEEAALEGAEARAAGAGGRRDWQAGAERRRARPPFRLRPTGRPEWALVWKNLVAGRRQRSGRLLGGALVVVASGLLLVFSVLPPPLRLAGGGGVCLALVAFLVLFGPGALRLDLRLDLKALPQLKALPLTGRQVVAAELAAPALVLAGMQWALLAAAALLTGGLPDDVLPAPVRLTLLAGAALVAPVLSLAGLLVQNAGVLLAPAWVEPEADRVRGIEAMGQRLISLVGTLVVLAAGVLPALTVAAGVGWPLVAWLGPVGGVLGAAAGGTALLAEVAVGVLLLGRLYDRMDVSEG